MNKSDLVFFDVDTQNDFIDQNGSLYIKGVENIRPNLAKLIKYAVDNDITIVSTMDSHFEVDLEFLEFKPHCIPGTWGWQKIPETQYEDFQVYEPYDQDFEILSNRIIFKKRKIEIFSDTAIMENLKKLRKSNFIVFGVATDYCVNSAVVGLLNEGFNVWVVEDAIAGINKENSAFLLEQMSTKGAKLITTQEIIENLV